MEPQPKTLLVVDDESDLLAELCPMLERAGYRVARAADGQEALGKVPTVQPDLIILDVLMPKMDGRELLRRLRQADNWVPVILLTQVNTAMERVMSLQEGADDYLNKPFDPMELLARIQAILRRAERSVPAITVAQQLRSGELQLDRQARRVSHRGKWVELTMRAFDLLVYLMQNSQEAIGRDRLLDEVWGWSYAVSTRAVDIRIAEIRKALGDNAEQPTYIETVTGYGYRFMRPVQAE
ncbi:MAG: response regulator transcription factor [Anaerolineales bacterium]|nr:response regulator transcription factor [Anaerolineales bacterium]MCB9126726.1 response regulator transcription factor [Ardenticatenales bacterium]MCB9171732.1 response regulator transcription factor [Ardenticatenales bacterium]